jgi:hypothetical protein
MATDFKQIPTSAEVWAVIMARHHADLTVYASFSDPDGSYSGGEFCRMETAYGLKSADFPLMSARTTWRKGEGHKRVDEKHEYWLCAPIKED